MWSVRTGCDLQDVDEVAAAVRDFGAAYLDRVYTAAEQAACAGETGWSAPTRASLASLAARFAAKEAVLKLIGEADEVDLRGVEIVRKPDSGRPLVRLSGRAAELAVRERLGPIDLSLSHTGSLAMAVAVAVAMGAPADPLASGAPGSLPETSPAGVQNG